MPLMTEQVELSYCLTFQEPFHCGTGLRAGLVDRTVQRDSDGYVCVPGSTVKGVVRDRCERVANLFGLRAADPHDERERLEDFRSDPDLVQRLFGSRCRAGTLFFDDAALAPEWREFFDHPTDTALRAKYREWQVETRARVSLSRLTRAARAGLLFTSEYGQAGVSFEGQVYGSISSLALGDGSATFGLVLLLAGMLAVERVGGNRSAGLGWCCCALRSMKKNGLDQEVGPWIERLDELELHDIAQEDE